MNDIATVDSVANIVCVSMCLFIYVHYRCTKDTWQHRLMTAALEKLGIHEPVEITLTQQVWACRHHFNVTFIIVDTRELIDALDPTGEGFVAVRLKARRGVYMDDTRNVTIKMQVSLDGCLDRENVVDTLGKLDNVLDDILSVHELDLDLKLYQPKEKP